jgi:fumarylacetoacetase
MSTNQLIDPNDPALRSWVSEANDPTGDFPIQNLPYGIVDGAAAVRIGDSLLVLQDALHAGLFSVERAARAAS